MGDSDVLTKKQIYDHIKANGDDSSTPPIDLKHYSKKDRSNGGMQGPLKMNFNHIEDIANPRDGKSDLVPYQYFSQWYMKFDDDNGKMYVKNPINMGNKKITGLQEPIHHKDAATKLYIDNSMVLKADIFYVDDEIAKIQHLGDLSPYMKRDGSIARTGNFKMNNFNINNVKAAMSGHQAIN